MLEDREYLLAAQRTDGSWPAFCGDAEGSWATALALCTLNTTGDLASAREKALRWLDAERGREGYWFWRWKFKTVDRSVRFDPDKYGWPWTPGSASWVIPTAFQRHRDQAIYGLQSPRIIGEANPFGCRDASGPRMC